MKKIEIPLYIIITSLVLMDLLIFGGILYKFYNFDSTIIAAIIAFFGAIIGGYITLIGVRSTIEDNNKRDLYKSLIKQHEAIVKTIKLFSAVRGEVWKYHFDHVPYARCNIMIKEALEITDGIIDTGTRATEKVYDTLVEYNQHIDHEFGLIFQDDSIAPDKDLYHDIERRNNKCMEILVSERTRIQQKIYKNHPK
ncbi:hypothetical protein ACQKND_04150 [Viridibacillus arvi]|uniref:hypothetical protein n=1 Tax=Viridibacillus arvi TaxID=263475 RepID=UPI003D02C862